ncbi:hypothetical protein EZV62_002045 [Acer yangbiense]|uniref:SWIM-type domain-containing protein n=1 Tax=Acer yangbiense TaxID=1000413 RepID=A0A5C7IYD6_9ROSI|nr:hypothetical protein EZV62_002045 [Acer yangbiense]
MGRMHSHGKGISSSARPYKRTPLIWLKISSQDVDAAQTNFIDVGYYQLLNLNRNIDMKRLVIYHGGSWVGNSYEGGLTKWVHVPRGLTYDALVKLVQDVAKIDAARYTIELCSLVSTNIGVARPIIENDNEVSCMMDEDKSISMVYVTICQKGPTDCVQNGTTVDEDDNLLQSNFFQQSYQPTPQPRYGGFVQQLAAYGSIPISDPIVGIDETIHDQENSQVLDTDNSDDVLIPNINTDNSDDGVDDGVGAGSASATPSGSFGENGLGGDGSGEHPTPRAWSILGSERYSLKPNRMDEAISNDGCLYKGKLFRCKKDLKGTVHKYALNENFELWIRRSSKTRYEAGCKDSECEFQLCAYKMQKEEYWVVRIFVKDHTCNIDGFHARFRQANSWTVGELLAPKLKVNGHSLKPKDIMVEMQVEHGLHLLYTKAWRAKDHAEASVFGAPEESFKLLPAYCHRLKEVNPDTVTAYQKSEFKEVMLEMMKVNRVAFKDLINVGPERWSHAYSPVTCYHLITSSIAESMNSCLVHARQMPITTMVEYIREMIQKWFYKRRAKVEKTQTQLSPWATELIKERNYDSEKYTVCPIDLVNFNVKDGNKDGLVNLSEKTCSCMKFQVDKLPCCHALAAIRLLSSCSIVSYLTNVIHLITHAL